MGDDFMHSEDGPEAAPAPGTDASLPLKPEHGVPPPGSECHWPENDRKIHALLAEAASAISSLAWADARERYRRALILTGGEGTLADALREAVTRLDDTSIQSNPHGAVAHQEGRVTQLGNVILNAGGLHQAATVHLRASRWAAAEQVFQRLKLLCPEAVTTFDQFRFDHFVARREGRCVYFRQELLPTVPAAELHGETLSAIAEQVANVLRPIGPFYAHLGGAGDALLLLATFLDEHPDAQVVSFARFIPAMRSFFDAFPSLRRVLFLPQHAAEPIHALLRSALPELPNCQGAGTTPAADQLQEWNDQLDIFAKYGVDPGPAWIGRFRKPLGPQRVALAPQGGLAAIAVGKRNQIQPKWWPEIVALVQSCGCTPVILGTPDEAAEYPAPAGCDDQRSYSFQTQMEQIASSEMLVGANSWGKTFAALADLPALVFDSIKDSEWKGKKDPADYVFLDPWPSIRVVGSLEAFREAFLQARVAIEIQAGRACPVLLPRITTAEDEFPGRKSRAVRVAWEGPFLDGGSVSQVNRSITNELIRQSDIKLTRVDNPGEQSQLRRNPALSALARGLKAAAPKVAEVTVRHASPPNWQPPERGLWVLVQPWGFGSLPLAWLPHLDKVDEIWAPSECERAAYVASGVRPSKVKLVPYGIDPELWHADVPPRLLPTRKSFKFLFVGDASPSQGADLLVQAFLETFQAGDDVCLVIKDVGDQGGSAGPTLEAQIKAAQARPDAPEILYLKEEGPEALPGLFTACDCLVHPYRAESSGLPVLEAMACGLPVVVTGGGATDDFATDQYAYRLPAERKSLGSRLGDAQLARRGWWLEPSVADLAQRMQWVLENREEARAKGRAAAEYVRREWSWERAARIAARRLQNLVARRQVEETARRARRARKPAPIEIPAVARLGELQPTRDALRARDLVSAWNGTAAALQARPFHPEAYLLLAEIAVAAGDPGHARVYAECARRMAPKFKSAAQLLKQLPREAASPPAELPSVPPGTRRFAGEKLFRVSAGQRPSLTVCLIVQNEEQYLGTCLASVRPLADQIVVVDTGSTDLTTEIAAQFGAEVYSFPWNDDFSAARNAALEHATGDWILILDADEELLPADRDVLKQELLAREVMAYRLPILDKGKAEEGPAYAPRLFRNAPGLFFTGRVQEQIFSRLEARRKEWGLEHRLSAVTLLHHGAGAELSRARRRHARNLRLLECAVEESPNDPNLLMHYGLELAHAGQADEGLQQCREAVRVMSMLPPSRLAPELRETLLTRFSMQLLAAREFAGVVKLLQMPLAKAGGLTASMHFAVGVALMELGQFGPAARQMRQCLAKRQRPVVGPVHPDIRRAGPHHRLALCLQRLRRPAHAAQAFEAALAEEPRSVPVRQDYARFLADQNRAEEALQWLRQLVSESPGNVEAWLLGGHIALRRPELLELARDWTAEALTLCPHAEAVLAQRAEALLLSQDVAQALPLWRRTSPANPRSLAARLVCELLNGGAYLVPAAAQPEVSRELLKWYRALLGAGAHEVISALNRQLDQLRQILPVAGQALEQALAAAGQEASG